MIILIVGLVITALVGITVAWLAGSIVRSKVLGALMFLAVTPALAFFPVMFALGGSTPTSTSFSHVQLEADRAMTQRMGVVSGPAMDAQMASDGMLGRSASDAYVEALEQHVADFDRMAGSSS